MKKTVSSFLIPLVLTALWGLYNGCKTNKPFDIRGVWEFAEDRADSAVSEGDSQSYIILEGSINGGTVERYPVKDDYWRGTYQVDINQVVIHIGYCRGPACMNFYYRGSVINENLVTGTLEGYASLGGDVYHTWTGTWQISR